MMKRLVALSAAVLFCATLTVAAGPTKYGTALTLKDSTKVSDIFAQPGKFNGMRVRVQGKILDVCSMAGCWIAIGGDIESQTIRFKVDDGVIVFPMTIKGKTAAVEGVVAVAVLSEAEQIEQGEMEAKEKKTTFDRKSVKGSKMSIQIKGEGAEVY